ncbi:sulfite exporter TauE/SafE family protein [Aquitalea sp. LB_tupeE]|uniref:HoxN/HupN/NixA family nickel/cobalt transporter n=1 Tax=Aquitalea sp. LB_tupeE TaxID=2748078 RepID=UPI0015BF71BC|nr:sulfite exporter TauE/SafE family protein [Aquitalea sp. LB_tupeE]NWK76558.1 sulfite exporter TauE/SafE family protein [Aquitalea sp. LB_tupeE]
MPPLAELIQQGSANLWLFIPSAILLGALHGLEPGHSKTLMASFIIAIRGSIAQAVLLGLCAALSHSLVVWLLAASALHYGNQLLVEQAEPWLLLLSGIIVLGIASWMAWRTRLDNLAAQAWQRAPHGGKMINTGHGLVELVVEGKDSAARFRLYCYSARLRPQKPDSEVQYRLQVRRDDGRQEDYLLQAQGGYLQAERSIALPHQFSVTLHMLHGNHGHQFALRFGPPAARRYHQSGQSAAATGKGSMLARPARAAVQAEPAQPYQDAHEKAHAEEIARRFAGKTVSNGQIALFGLTGGLMPCPASVTILLICLQLKRVALGLTMVASFSIGLAISLVSVGVVAAWGARRLGEKFHQLDGAIRRLPYLSSLMMVVIAAVMMLQGGLQLAG